jgi:hypothetical protein
VDDRAGYLDTNIPVERRFGLKTHLTCESAPVGADLVLFP